MGIAFIASRVALIVLSTCLLASCKSINDDNPQIEAKNTLTSGPELHAVAFRSGRPTGQEGLMDSVVDVSDAISAMKHDLRLISSIQSVGFTVVGTTDNAECAGEECNDLSLKRARLVQEWLVRNGAAASKFSHPIGRGNPFPRDYRSNEEERSMTRSVKIEIQ